ncbi:MAG: isochorismate synthase [Myxococcota bacterium]
MTVAPSPALSEHADEAALASLSAQIEQVRRPGAAVLLSVRHRLSAAEPWAWLDPERTADETFVAWHEPAADLTFAALGTAASHLLTGPARLADAAAWCSHVRELHHTLGDKDDSAESAPFILSSLAFRHREPGALPGPWADFGDGLLWVPRLLISTQGGQTWATLHEPIAAAESTRDAAARVLSRQAALARRPNPAPASALLGLGEPTAAERGDWEARASRAIAALERNDTLSKIVLARASEQRAPAGHVFDALATARALRARHSGCTVFAIGRPGGATFVGATPELLVHVAAEDATTAALAGTAPRGASPDSDARLASALSAGKKDLREHELVVSAIVDALAQHARDHAAGVVAAGPHLRSLADVHHLETSITASLKSPGRLWDLVTALHPTPAVGGVPRDEALAWLAAHEGLDRGAYAGPVGWVDSAGDGVFHVALRSALLFGDRALAYAGAGLVSGSSPADEWAETEHKLRAIRSALCVRRATAPR